MFSILFFFLGVFLQKMSCTTRHSFDLQVARLRDLALVSIDDAESPPFDETERICSAAKVRFDTGHG